MSLSPDIYVGATGQNVTAFGEFWIDVALNTMPFRTVNHGATCATRPASRRLKKKPMA
jgi:hypothetical protein